MTKKLFLSLVLSILVLSIFIVSKPIGERQEKILNKCHQYCGKQFPTGWIEYSACMLGCTYGATMDV